ncbi:MAG: LacI family DNA-binding transcriptional regulator [Chromatiaceae bacterium]|nr:LacI family DNA-binding transcriptional regulator [Chromatiaceae bacterium]MCP5423196.1 LacI family DNA-binding transcriptional regulator [Chromatiaceae bacterium]
MESTHLTETGTRKRRRTTTPGTSGRQPSSRSGSESVTLEDVARLAGVSTITVSRALNYPDKVAAKTLEKVNRAIGQTGYVPNLLAGGLASRRTRLIAAIIPSIANLVYAETIQYFSERLKDAGYQVLLGESGYPEQSEQKLISAILSRRPDGILLTGVNHSADCRRLLLAANVPLVETWDLTPSPLDVVVGFSHERIGAAIADFIAAKGYRRVGSVSASDRRAKIREKAVIDRLAEHGITDVVGSEVPVPTDLRRGRTGLVQLLAAGFDRGVVFCSSDTLAQGVLVEAQARGIRVPQDLAIIGFGDQSFAADTHPALSTVRIDRPRMGRVAAEALLARIDDEPLADPVIDVGFEFIERGTT